MTRLDLLDHFLKHPEDAIRNNQPIDRNSINHLFDLLGICYNQETEVTIKPYVVRFEAILHYYLGG